VVGGPLGGGLDFPGRLELRGHGGFCVSVGSRRIG
jgi:hypothetical protein